MPEFREFNKFHEYMSEVLSRRGISTIKLAEDLWGNKNLRIWVWDMSHRVSAIRKKQEERFRQVAELLGEPMSKLLFLGGHNPWANRLSLADQWALWEFAERLAKAKEEGTGKPPLSFYNRLCKSLFGGCDVVQTVTNNEMADFLKAETEDA